MAERTLTDQARTRLRRIEGQVRGLQRMLDRMDQGSQPCGTPGEPCDGLLTQVLAVRAAVEQVGLLILELHLERCVMNDVPLDQARLRDLRETLKTWSRLTAR